MSAAEVEPAAFRTAAAFRRWLERHHDRASELLVRCFKSGHEELGIGYREALDEALCFGWIDGVRRAHDAVSFSQRFTPRRPGSRWSAVNVRRARELEAAGRLHPSGLAAFRARPGDSAGYSFESAPRELDAESRRTLERDPAALAFFEAMPPGYRRTTLHWILSAKRPETRAKRLTVAIESWREGLQIPILRRAAPPAPPAAAAGRGTKGKPGKSGSTTKKKKK